MRRRTDERVLALLSRSFFARFPNTKSIASITLDLPLPLGPTTEVMWRSKGPMVIVLAYDFCARRVGAT